MPDFTIRKAEKNDAKALADLTLGLNLYHGDDTRPDEAVLLKNWARFETFVAEIESSIVGFVGGYSYFLSHMGVVGYELQNLYVCPDRQRMGIASALLHHAIALNVEKGVERFSLGVIRSNEAAQSLYQSLGFFQSKVDAVRYGLGGDALRAFLEKQA